MSARPPVEKMEALRRAYGDEVQEQVELARYTSARIGGPADVFLPVASAEELVRAARTMWDLGLDFRILGGGSNILVSDRGVREVVLWNQAKAVRLWESDQGPRLQAESGASLGSAARRASARGWTGLEWAATIPGTVGGAVVGNAGAYGRDMAESLALADILQQGGSVEVWPVKRLAYGYRDSWFKRNPGAAVVIAATMQLETSTPEETDARMRSYIEGRHRSQPPGASMGSMFKNPAGDYAGRLIEEAGLKGTRHGGAEISAHHANFFINIGGATAEDVWTLIRIARDQVALKCGVELELEVELFGDWEGMAPEGGAGKEGVGS